MRKLFSIILFLSTCLVSTAQPNPVDLESIFSSKEIFPLRYLPKNPYDIPGLEINGNDWKMAANYEFRKFNKLEFVRIKCKPDELPAILEKLSELPVLRKLAIEEFPLSWDPGIIGDSLSFPENIKKLKSLTAIKFDFLRSYKWNSIAQQISYLPFLKHLSIRGLFTDYFDSTFKSLDQLVSLQISGESFLRLPEWIVNFHRLEFLDISGNQKLHYEDAFKTLAKLPSLRILKINNARIESFPGSIGNLDKLEKLYANYFYTKNFDQFFRVCSRLKNLKYLELNNGDSLSLPPSIGLLSFLEYLSLNDRKITLIPPEIGNLGNLKYLSLYQNKLLSIPGSIGNLKNLETFRIMSNQLVLLPPEIGNLSSLRKLDLNHNRINSIPVTIGNLARLENLDFGNNIVDSLPSSITNCKSLVSLLFGINKIKELPTDIGNLKKLETLSATGNEIHSLPASIGQLSNLRSLSLSFNSIRALPESFSLLSNLQNLSLSNNLLTELPSDFGKLTRLKELDLTSGTPSWLFHGRLDNNPDYNSNKLKGLPASFVKLDSLNTLQLTNSIVENGNQVLALLLKLKGPVARVHLENCAITALPLKGWDQCQIQYLELSRNAISNFPVSIIEAPLLQFLNLDENGMQPAFNRRWIGKMALLLTAIDQSLVGTEVIKTYDSITCNNILEAAGYYYNINDFEKLLRYYELAAKNCTNIKYSDWWRKDAYGVSLYQTGNYKEAIPYLAEYLKKDSSVKMPPGRIRVITLVYPAFDALAKSHLALKDTNNAIEVYRKWANKYFSREAATELALLSLHKKDKLAADAWFENAMVYQKREYGQPSLSALAQLETLVMQNNSTAIQALIDEVDITRFSPVEIALMEYLVLSHQLVNGKANIAELALFSEKIEMIEEIKTSWSYDLFESWIATINDSTVQSKLRLLTTAIKKKIHL